MITQRSFSLAIVISIVLAVPIDAEEKLIDNGAKGFQQTGLVAVLDARGHEGDVAVATDLTREVAAQYTPDVSGRYDVYLFWGDYPEKDTDVLWTVHHTGGATQHGFNQHHNPGYHFHGTYELDNRSRVSLDMRKGQDAPIVADAVRFVPSTLRVVDRVAKDTITPISLNYRDELRFRLRNGEMRKLTLLRTSAAVLRHDARGGVAQYGFTAELQIDGVKHVIQRVVPAQESFYEPLIVGGMRIWLDSVSDIFSDDGGFMEEKDISIGISCRPKRKARLVVNDVTDRICPPQLTWWYPESKDHIDIAECYQGEDVWMGPYLGRLAHGGLDINMPSGTPLFAPLRFDDHYLFDALNRGDKNNRWRGVRKWDNGAIWWLQAHHLNRMLTPLDGTLKQGTKYAETAGVAIGNREHTHFVFRVIEEGESYWIDPWILFWQTFQDHKTGP